VAREIKGWHPGLPIIDRPEYQDSPYFSTSFKVQVLEQKKTQFCYLEILFNPLFGNMMFIDGEIQISEADYEAYHDGMWYAANAPESRVLVVGDGDGGFTRYCPTPIEIVERDPDVCLAGARYFGAEWGNVTLHQKSLDEFEPSERYDVIMLAIDDGFNTAPELERELDRVAGWLKPGGRIVAQVGTQLDPKQPKILDRYKGWIKNKRLQNKRLRWSTRSTYIGCYFCQVYFLVILLE
jgi:spermidine synthase